MCKERKPHACPVCFGKGIVPNGFYTGNYSTTSTVPEQCKTCWGVGIVWG